MTREEAIDVLGESKRQNEVMRDNPSTFWTSNQMADGIKNAERRVAALDLALSALRAPTREQAEKMRGEWETKSKRDKATFACSGCGRLYGAFIAGCANFCPR